MFIIHDAGKKASIFPGGGDAGDTEFIAQLLQEGIRGFVYVLAPQVGGVPEFHCVVVDVQVDRVVGDILKDDAVIPGILELGPKCPPELAAPIVR